jgi:hypothetical protein
MNPHVYADLTPPPPLNIPPLTPFKGPAPSRHPSRESELQKLCESELNRRGIEYLHLSPMAREKKGWPDLVFALHGTAYAVELKSQTGTLSDDQSHRLARMEQEPNRWTVRLIRTFEDFRRLLAEAAQQHEPKSTGVHHAEHTDPDPDPQHAQQQPRRIRP